MNNKPVAWIDKNTGKPRMEGFIQTDHDIPLYTHLVKELTMTDDEVMDLWNQAFSHPADFARAILLKAQE